MEHEENNTDFTPGMNGRRIFYGHKQRKIWAHEKARQNVPQNQRLPDFSENNCDNACSQHHDSQVGNQSWNVHVVPLFVLWI